MVKKKKVTPTVDFYRRDEVVSTFEADRYSSARGELRYELQNDMALRLIAGTKDPLLEIAGGTGRFTRQLVGMGRDVTVMDSSWAMIQSNRHSQQNSFAHKISFIQGLAQNLPFKSNTFGTIFCVDMFSHVEKPEPIIMEMSRVLKVGGSLIINFTNKSSAMGLGASFISNPLRTLFGKMEVYSTYHWSKVFLGHVEKDGLEIETKTGLFFIDPRLYRFEFGPRFKKRVIQFETWVSRKKCRFFYEQVWLKAVKR